MGTTTPVARTAGTRSRAVASDFVDIGFSSTHKVGHMPRSRYCYVVPAIKESRRVGGQVIA